MEERDEGDEGGVGMTRKTAMVVGGASGIGKAVARRLAGSGWHVVVADVASSEGTVKEIRDAGGSCEAQALDLRQTESFAAIFARPTLTRFGRL